MAISGIKGYNILLRSDMKTLTDDTDETKERIFTARSKILNNTWKITYIKKKEDNNYGDAIRVWVKTSRKFKPTTRFSKTTLWKKLEDFKLENVTR